MDWLARFLFLPIVTLCAMTLCLTGCSATNVLVSEWSNPGYRSASFKRIMVGGLGGATSVRRNFEDEFVAQLRATGIDALPSYREMPDNDQVNEASMKQAAKKAGADGAILVKSIQVEEKRQYSPSYYPVPWFGFYGSHVGASWSGYYGAPSVYHYNEYTSETTLYDLNKNEVVWSGTLTTTETSDVKAAIRSYVETVMNTLREKNLLSNRE